MTKKMKFIVIWKYIDMKWRKTYLNINQHEMWCLVEIY